jgi:hypothetical protein
MLGSFLKNYDMFGQLCGDEALANVVLVTTMWGRTPEEEGASREQELKQNFWAVMLGHGSLTARYMHTHESAWEIVDMLLPKERLHSLLIQRELVDLGKTIPETAAGRTLRMHFQDTLKEYEKIIQRKRTIAARRIGENNEVFKIGLMRKDSVELMPDSQEIQKRYEAAEQELRATEKKLQDLLGQIQALRIPISARISQFFGFR